MSKAESDSDSDPPPNPAEDQKNQKAYEQVYFKVLQKEDVEKNQLEATRLEDLLPNSTVIMIRNKGELFSQKAEAALAAKNAASWMGGCTLEPDEVQAILGTQLSPEELKELNEKSKRAEEGKKDPEPVVDYPKDFVDKKVAFQLPKLRLNISSVLVSGEEKILTLGAYNFDFG
jgi:hypothetical protein